MKNSRKKFMLNAAAGAAAILLTPTLAVSGMSAATSRDAAPPLLDRERVKEFVGAAHKDMEKVKSMLRETPELLNASHNWNDWDWEDAIGAAGHMGLRELALYLLDQGARPTIAVAAMLGQLDVVKNFINAFPAMKEAVGPHKISLVRHAKAGGDRAKEVLEYLQSIGAKE